MIHNSTIPPRSGNARFKIADPATSDSSIGAAAGPSILRTPGVVPALGADGAEATGSSVTRGPESTSSDAASFPAWPAVAWPAAASPFGVAAGLSSIVLRLLANWVINFLL